MFENVLPRGPLPCGAVVSGEIGSPEISKAVDGKTYYAIPGSVEGFQFPHCPHPDCRGLIKVPDVLPGGEYRCLCQACRFQLFRDADCRIHLTLLEDRK